MTDAGDYASKYISDQYGNYKIDGKKMKDISFGFGSIAANGCGVIAAYNVLLSKSSKIEFNNVKKGIILSGGLNAGGLLGVNPWALALYMRFKFRHVFIAGPNTKSWETKAELCESVIVLLKKAKSLSMHYAAGIGTGKGGVGGSFKFYNTGLYDKNRKSVDCQEMPIGDFLDYIKPNGAKPLYLIGVYDKKGSW